MNEYRHHVSGIFANRAEAQSAFANLVEKGLQGVQMQIFDTGSELPAVTQQTKSNQVLKDMVVDGAIGTAVGTGIGGLAGVAVIATNVSLFVASPLLAPLAPLGWGASLGG